MIVHSTALYWWQRGFHLTDFLVPLWYGALGVSYWRIGLNLGVYVVIVIAIAWSESTRREREQRLALSRLATQLADSRLYALRMQLNPHFLFNALNSVAMLVRQGKNDVAVGVVTALGDLLRHLLREPSAMEVALSEELTFLERYFSVERVRMGDRLRTTVTADPEALRAIVPSLILQPLVENAIKHGIARSPLGGEIRISARREGDRLLLEVADTGSGLDSGDSTVGFGLGLSNTVQRLEEMYGENFGFELTDSAPGVRASLSIPFNARLPEVALR
jgi:LytS/YehU family sensor histidine kinase